MYYSLPWLAMWSHLDPLWNLRVLTCITVKYNYRMRSKSDEVDMHIGGSPVFFLVKILQLLVQINFQLPSLRRWLAW